MKNVIKLFGIIAFLVVVGLSMTGCFGTYTFSGNTATLTFEGEIFILTISGNTLSGEEFSATRLNDEDIPTSRTNPFMGAWGDEDGNVLIFDDTEWLLIPAL